MEDTIGKDKLKQGFMSIKPLFGPPHLLKLLLININTMIPTLG